MPTKLNRAGEQQNYVPAGNGDASGEYGNHKGSNRHFTNFKKEGDSFESVNKQRVGNKMSSQPKAVEQPKVEEPVTYDEWAKSIMTQQRVGNPPTEIKIRLQDTPLHITDEEDRQAALREFKPETVDKAIDLIKKYEQSVDETAADLENIADQMGGVMVGMEFRLKRLGSTSRKLESYVIEEHANGNTNFTLDDAVGKMRDTARFTMVFDEKGFENGVKGAIGTLEKQGYKLARAKNTFVEGAGYKGLNCNFIDKKGNIFELQFHVPLSMKIKEGIEVDVANKRAVSDRRNVTAHDIYEKTRVLEDKQRAGTITPGEQKLYDDMIQKSKQRWAEVPNYELSFLK